MGLLSFAKSVGAKIFGATETAAGPPEQLKKEAEKLGLDVSKVEVKTKRDKVILSGSAASKEDAGKIASRYVQPLLAAALLTLALILLDPPSARADDGNDSGPAVRVMTWNVDVGSDFKELIAAQTLPEFVAAATKTFQNILATKPVERAAAVAREIARKRPDVAGLQEVWNFRTETPATTVQADLLELLLSELAKLGKHYAIIATVPELDAEVPTTLGFNVRITTQDAIIARTDIGMLTGPPQVHQFTTLLTIPTVIGPFTIKRGWASLDATIRGQSLRFVTTHLDPTSPSVELAQATELLQTAGDTLFPVVFAGDFNATADDKSDPTFPSYQINGGFRDTWQQEHPEKPGFTCCQDPNLLNTKSKLNHRIDLILFRGAIDSDDVKLVGNKHADLTPSGLWPSRSRRGRGNLGTSRRTRGPSRDRGKSLKENITESCRSPHGNTAAIQGRHLPPPRPSSGGPP